MSLLNAVISLSFLLFLFDFFSFENWKKKETSCPAYQCLNGGKCSTRFNGNYSCQCSSSYNGTNCQNGILLEFSIFQATFFS